MKITLDINDRLLAEATALAARERITLAQVVAEGLQMRLRRGHSAARRGQFVLPISRQGGGFVAGIASLSNHSLYDAADDQA